MIDLRGIPAHECVCGSNMFNLKVIFEGYEIGMYLLDMTCVQCNAILTAPTPLDDPNNV